MSQRLSRKECFDDLAKHPWFGKIYAKLKKPELQLCAEFIAKHDDLDQVKFEHAVNRMFMDMGDKRPKNWALILDLLTACAIASHQKKVVYGAC